MMLYRNRERPFYLAYHPKGDHIDRLFDQLGLRNGVGRSHESPRNSGLICTSETTIHRPFGRLYKVVVVKGP